MPVERTVSRIEQALADAGASGTSKEYNEGRLVALTFSLTLPSGRPVQVRLPASEENVYDAMVKHVVRMRAGTAQRLRQQAGRTAWKLMQDWVEVQLSLIQMQQADFMQVFLPYVWDGKQTFYAALKAKNFGPLLLAEEST